MDDEVIRQWLATGVFLLTLAALGAIETVWLVRRGWASTGRSVAYVVLTDILSIGISLGASMAFALLLLMMVFGPSGEGTTGYAGLMTVITIIGVSFPLVVFFLTKRVFLYFLRISAGKYAWLYSLVVSLIILVFGPLPAVAFYYLLRLIR